MTTGRIEAATNSDAADARASSAMGGQPEGSANGTSTAGRKRRPLGVYPWRIYRRMLARLQTALTDGIRYAEPNLKAIGIVGVVGMPGYWVIWALWLPQEYENLLLRLTGMIVLLPLALIDYWPLALRRWLTTYWLLAMLYALPFFFTFMLLKNDMSTVWSMSTMAALFLLVLLIPDWLLVVVLFAAGTALAWAADVATGGTVALPPSYVEQLPVYAFVILAGSIFNYRADLLSRERLDAMLAVSRNIAHELRTPLLGIRSGSGGLQRYLPRLLSAYDQAQAAGLDVPPIREAHRRSLHEVLDGIDRETDYASTMIDMLLVNAGRHRLAATELAPTAMAECVKTALERYPFRSEGEQRKVQWYCRSDFVFHGSRLLMVHVIFNLLRNALQAVGEAGRGTVVIGVELQEDRGVLRVRDTGTGIPPEAEQRIYERFFSSRDAEHGAGIGLSFCRMVMDGLGGTIRCRSEWGSHTEFILTLPGAESHD